MNYIFSSVHPIRVLTVYASTALINMNANANQFGLALGARSKSTIAEMHHAQTASATTCTTTTHAFVTQVINKKLKLCELFEPNFGTF